MKCLIMTTFLLLLLMSSFTITTSTRDERMDFQHHDDEEVSESESKDHTNYDHIIDITNRKETKKSVSNDKSGSWHSDKSKSASHSGSKSRSGSKHSHKSKSVSHSGSKSKSGSWHSHKSNSGSHSGKHSKSTSGSRHSHDSKSKSDSHSKSGSHHSHSHSSSRTHRKKKKPKWPTPEPTNWPTPEPTKKKKPKWPTPEPTKKKKKKKWPTPRPSDWPTPEPITKHWPTSRPSKWPTPEPTQWPTPEPTDWPTPEPSQWPTPEPTAWPTPEPSMWPTPEPTDWPTPEPTKWPTNSPIRDSCVVPNDAKFDFIVLYDNSCGLSDEDCDNLLEGTAEIISRLLNYPTTKVQTMQFEAKSEARVIVGFDEKLLQKSPLEYVLAVRQHGECTNGGAGSTNLIEAVKAAISEFDLDDDRIDKIVIVSACMEKDTCEDLPQLLTQSGIDVNVVNLIKASKAKNVIKKDDAFEYLLCLADDDPHRVCVGDCSKGVTIEQFDWIIEECLLATICEIPTQSPTMWPTPEPTDWPTPEPTAWPTPEPTDWPTPEPTAWPTPEPTAYPTPEPTAWPTPEPSDWPTPEPTAWPTPEPTDWPTPEPTAWPTPEPTAWPTPEPSMWPTPEPTAWPTPEPTEWPTPEPTEWPTPEPTNSPIADICDYEIRKGHLFDFVILLDNSCGLSSDDCENYLEGVAEIIGTVLDETDATRVAVKEIAVQGNANALVDFEDFELQEDPALFVQYVRREADCTAGGVTGKTDTAKAIHNAMRVFDSDDDRIDKIIIVSACEDTREMKYCKRAPALEERGIDVYAVNLMDASDATNVITANMAASYLQCLTDDDPNRICVGEDESGVSAAEFDDILECLLPQICIPPTVEPTAWPTPEPTEWPTPEPSMWPTPEPTAWPTPEPTAWPTPEPTQWPTPEPSMWPTPEPTQWPTPEPTEWPTPEPTDWPTPEPTMWPTPEPTQWPTPEPTGWPTPEPTEWPTPEPTGWPTEEPTERDWWWGPCTDEPTQSPTKSPTRHKNKCRHHSKKKKKRKKKKWPTPDPTEEITPEPSKKKKWPTPDPTKKRKKKWPTPEPTKKKKKKWPTPEPTEWPTPEPSKKKKWPTPDPTKKRKKKWPTPDPTTAEATKWPTPEPTEYPTPEPSKTWSSSDNSEDTCTDEHGEGQKFDFVIFIDNSCNLANDDCDTVLEGVGNLLLKLLDYPNAQVATLDFGEDKNDVHVVVGFDDDLQQTPVDYVEHVKKNGDCTDNGHDETDLYSAIKKGINILDHDDDGKNQKFIIVSACMDNSYAICKKMPGILDGEDIQVYIVNLIDATQNADNVISSIEEAEGYLSCLSNDVCIGADSEGMTLAEFDDIIACLIPDVCKPYDDDSDSMDGYPSPEPTPRPSPSPTNEPVEIEPTAWPTPEPTDWPTPEPIKQRWKSKKGKWPTPKPSRYPTPEPTQYPTEEPNSKKWKKNKKKKKKKWPTPQPTEWPTPEPIWKKTRKKRKVRSQKRAADSEDVCDASQRNNEPLDFVIFLDNSCKLKDSDCDAMRQGTGEIIYRLLRHKDIRIATILFGNTRNDLDLLVKYDDMELQQDAAKYVQFITQHGECTEGGSGDTNLYYAVKRAQQLLDYSKLSKFIFISACRDMQKVCSISKEITRCNIDSYIVNLIAASDDVDNVIATEEHAKEYLVCLNPKKLCIGDDLDGITVEEFDRILDECLLPDICEPNTKHGSSLPTPQPTEKPNAKW